MKITSVNYTKTFQVDERMWVKLGLTGEVEPTDNTQESIKQLESEVNEYFKAVLPKPPVKPALIPKTGKAAEREKEMQATVDGINNSKSIAELESFWMKSKNNLALSAPYQQKLKQLTDAK